jgi:YegS/Rv2252/BmrU family lipid kinase
MSILIFANPIAGRGQSGGIARQLEDALGNAGYATRTLTSRSTSADPLPADIEAAIVIGGDGTLDEVVSRFYRDTGSSPPLLLVPRGTANLMGQHLGFAANNPHPEATVIAALRAGRMRAIDVATANGRIMLLVAGVGIDAEVIHEMHRLRTGPISKQDYVLPAALAFSRFQYPALTVKVDGRIVLRDAPALAFVGNVPEYGTGFPVLPNARADDGLLDVCVVPCDSPQQLLEMTLYAAAGELLHVEGVRYVKGSRIQIDSAEAVAVQVDGDAAGTTPLDVHLLPVRLPLILPADL